MSIHVRVVLCVSDSPPDGATLLVVDLDELAEAAGVVVVGCLCISKGLRKKMGNTKCHHGKVTTVSAECLQQ